MKRIVGILLLSTACVQAAHDWDRYETIMERKPFGAEPPMPETPVIDRPTGSFAKEYRLCMLYRDAQGQRKAGLVSRVNNKNIFLAVGEQDGELLLSDVQIEEGIAVLQKNGETAQLILEGLSLPPAPPSAVPAGIIAARPVPAQIVQRNGTTTTPAHVLAALRDSAPKRPQMTVRTTTSFGGGSGGSQREKADASQTASSAPRPGPRRGGVADSTHQGSPDPIQMTSLPIKTPGGYALQSVPPGFEIDF